MSLSLLFLLAGLLAPDATPVTIVHGGPIYPLDAAFRRVEAFAYDAAGELEAVGELDALRRRFPQAAELDVDGATVLPGFIDAHGHLLGLGLSLLQVDLVGTRSVAEVLERLERFAVSLPPDAWLVGRGWDQNDWESETFPDRRDLDERFPRRPVFLTRIDGHAAWANSAAMDRVGRDFAGDWQVEGGQIVRDESGRATGVFVDAAADLVEAAVPPPDEALRARALGAALERLAAVGITAMHDAGTSLELFEQLAELLPRKRTLRVYAMADGDGAMLERLCRDGPVRGPFLAARSVKLYADGALGSRGAALLEDYSDDPGNRGLLLQEPRALQALVDRAMGCGLQVNVHAIGDRAGREVLDAFTATVAAHPDNPGRHRVEHAQILSIADLPRFAAGDFIASMQPTHATSDMYWAGDRLGEERLAGAYAWQTLARSGARLALGSDFPVERPDPLLGYYAAVSRQDLEGWPAGGWRPDERLARRQALRGFTIDAAYAAFEEASLGSLEPGKRADFVLLSDDIVTAPTPALRTVRVLATYVDGRAVYERPGR